MADISPEERAAALTAMSRVVRAAAEADMSPDARTAAEASSRGRDIASLRHTVTQHIEGVSTTYGRSSRGVDTDCEWMGYQKGAERVRQRLWLRRDVRGSEAEAERETSSIEFLTRLRNSSALFLPWWFCGRGTLVRVGRAGGWTT